MQTRNILTPSLAIFCIELQQAFDEGFRLVDENLPTQWGIAYEAILVRDEQRHAVIEAFKESPDEIDFSKISPRETIQKPKGRPRG